MTKLKYLVMNPINTGWSKPPLKYEYVPRYSYYRDCVYWDRVLAPIKTYIIPNEKHKHDVRNYGVSGFLLNK